MERRKQPPILGAVGFDGGFRAAIAFVIPPEETRVEEVVTAPTPTGACCAESGDCTVTTAAACSDIDGDYQGDGVDCETADCPQPQGACCSSVPDPNSCSIQDESACDLLTDGVWQGAGTTCDPDPCGSGACCHTDGSCTVTSEAGCDGIWLGNGTTCDAGICEGACCDEGTCLQYTALECEGADGIFFGLGSTCTEGLCDDPEGGACCFDDGSCLLYSGGSAEATCTGFGGTWMGTGTSCIECVGACCEGEDCSEVGILDCEGDFLGFGTDCIDCP